MHTKAEEDHMKLKRRGWVIESHQIFDTHFNLVWYFYGDTREFFFFGAIFFGKMLGPYLLPQLAYAASRE